MKLPEFNKPLTLQTIVPMAMLGFYIVALRLYPRAFRERYAGQMAYAAHAEIQQSQNLLRTVMELSWDLVKSLPGEYWRAANPLRPADAAASIVFLAALLLTLSVGYQQILRRHADHVALRLANDIADRIASAPAGAFLAEPHREIASPDWLRSSNLFIVLYSDAGNPIAGNATLHGALPHPPAGVLRYASIHRLDKVTWQPEPRIRLATVTKKLSTGGFVVTGKSIVGDETRESRFSHILVRIWLVLSAAILGICTFVRLRPRFARP